MIQLECWYCKEPMKQKKGNLGYTFLESMKNLRITNCPYFYCEKCDIVTFSKRVEEQIKRELQNEKCSRIVINL